MATGLSGWCCTARARGYDVAVFLRDLNDLGTELHRLADLSSRIIDETGEFVHAMPYPAGSYNERTPLMLEIRTDRHRSFMGKSVAQWSLQLPILWGRTC
jgi:hypothetical protein